MKQFLALLLSILLLSALAPAALAEEAPLWTRTEGDGAYVTIRIPDPADANDLGWAKARYRAVRYADTKEPVALSSDHWMGYLFATVPAEDADRPLEVFQGERFDWTDVEYQNEPMGANLLYIRGVLQGDSQGRLNLDQTLTRAEAFTLLVRLLGLEPGEAPGYADVKPADWYYDAVSAARAAGLAAEDETFRPNDEVSRAEFTTMVYRAFRTVGWARTAEGTAAELDLVDGGSIPDWALEAYLALERCGNISTYRETEEMDPTDGAPIPEYLAEPGKGATREEVIELLEGALRWLPVYPSQEAIALGFDQSMPVIDGSTSTYPYTSALYGRLFQNYSAHPDYPEKHSKSHTSYERLINGEADVLFAATKASNELEEQAKAAGVELEYIPIAYDAMVFFTNEENPVKGLTIQQLQDIYARNAYGNWNQVGGPDAKLMPYCRNTDSGSHALMERLILGGGALSLSEGLLSESVSTAMQTALTDVATALETDPAGYAIGYSVYYYYQNAEAMMGDVTENRLRLLEIDGVAPSDETIAGGAYPLSSYNYIVLRASEPEDSPARRLADFMAGEAGQEVVVNAGFGALAD